MGGVQSLPTDLTHEKLFDLTKDTRSIMNILLEYMLKEVTVRDFLALSNPSECKKYVLFKANTLYKYFYELQITPTKDKKGIIAFRPIRELINPQGSEDEKERQSLCLIIAYYYTRIFQIYGALALTLIDDVEFATKSGLLDIFKDEKEQRLYAPGQRLHTKFIGGAIPYSTLMTFYFLRGFLLEQIDRTKGYKTIYRGEGNSRAEVFFRRKTISEKEDRNEIYTISDIENKLQKGFFTIGYLGAKKYATLEVIAKKEAIGSSNILFEFGKLYYYKKGASELLSTEIPYELLPKKKLSIITQQPFGQKGTVYSIKDSEQEIPDYFTDVFTKLVPYIKSLSEGTEFTILKSDIKDSKIQSEVDTTEQLRLGRIIQNLTKTKPLGHCIARALQLLRSAPFKDEPGISHICKAKFLESSTSSNGTKVIISRSGIPVAGSTLDTSPGLSALALLFYDTIQEASVKIGVEKGPDGKSTLEQYISFMSKMARLFGDEKDSIGNPRPGNYYLTSGLRGIHNKRDKELCSTIPKSDSDGDISITSPTAKIVYEHVKELFKTQLIHASKCGGIFKELFNINRDKSSGRFRISLSDNIIRKGFPEIERINYKAREILVDYYSKCETTYLHGMKTVIDSKRRIDAIIKP
jgi:hypothetical protein